MSVYTKLHIISPINYYKYLFYTGNNESERYNDGCHT